jgi:hypothetical protein
MGTVKTLGVALAVVLFLGGYAYAQERSNTQTQPTAPEHPGARRSLTVNDVVQRMKLNLNLTQEQADAAKPIIEKNMTNREELVAALQQPGADRNTIRKQIEQSNQEQNQRLSKIFDQGQMDKLMAMENEGRFRDKERQSGVSR